MVSNIVPTQADKNIINIACMVSIIVPTQADKNITLT